MSLLYLLFFFYSPLFFSTYFIFIYFSNIPLFLRLFSFTFFFFICFSLFFACCPVSRCIRFPLLHICLVVSSLPLCPFPFFVLLRFNPYFLFLVFFTHLTTFFPRSHLVAVPVYSSNRKQCTYTTEEIFDWKNNKHGHCPVMRV